MLSNVAKGYHYVQAWISKVLLLLKVTYSQREFENYIRKKILTIWLTGWLRTIPLSLITMNDSRAIEMEPFIAIEFVDHSSIFRIVSLH